MPSVSRAGGLSPTASVSLPPPGTVNRGSSVSNGPTGGLGMSAPVQVARASPAPSITQGGLP